MPCIRSVTRMMFFVAAMLMLIAASGADAQPSRPAAPRADAFMVEHRAARRTQPRGVTLTIRFAAGRREFVQGEVIPLELVFACAAPCGYKANAASYDRSGQLDIDDYHIDRGDGAVDPLADYFYSGVSGFIGGGMSSDADLDQKPFRITRELNEWYRFDEPGRYRLYVTSNRVSKKRDLYRLPARSNSLVIASNIIEFDVTPPVPAWTARKLAEATAALDAPAKTNYGSGDERRRAACRALRFLGTRAAAREMIARWRGEENGCDLEFSFGLIGSPHQSFVIEEMERRLIAPDQPVTPGYLYTLSLLSVLDNPTVRLPLFPEENSEAAKAWQAQAEKQRAVFDVTRDRYAARLAEAVASKTEAARAVSIDTLLGYESNASSATRATPWRRKLAATLPDVFFALPPQTQTSLLGYRWHSIASTAMLPVLRRVYEDDSPRTGRELRGFALLRLYRMTPGEGRDLMIEEIGRRRPRVDFSVLDRLPDETLPELDDRLATNMERSVVGGENIIGIAEPGQHAEPTEYVDYPELHIRLVERYATAAVSPRVRALFEKRGVGSWACAPQAALLAYFLRVEPVTGEALLRQALTSRQHTRCYPSVLKDVASLYATAELEEVASDALTDPDPEVVAGAAAVLGEHGSAAAEDRLWRRLEEWHGEWSGRVAEIDKYQPGVPAFGAPPAAAQVSIENALVTALGSARSWVLDAERAKRLRALVLTPTGKQRLTEFAEADESVISIYHNPDDDYVASLSVAQYRSRSIEAFKEKLAQYPAGTVFVWAGSGRDDKEDARLYGEIKQHVGRLGMKLAPNNSPKDAARE